MEKEKDPSRSYGMDDIWRICETINNPGIEKWMELVNDQDQTLPLQDLSLSPNFNGSIDR